MKSLVREWFILFKSHICFSHLIHVAVSYPCFSSRQKLLAIVKFPDCCLWVCSFSPFHIWEQRCGKNSWNTSRRRENVQLQMWKELVCFYFNILGLFLMFAGHIFNSGLQWFYLYVNFFFYRWTLKDSCRCELGVVPQIPNVNVKEILSHPALFSSSIINISASLSAL